MPTDYDGDRTETQPPSDPPGPEAQITVALIADGDDVDAGTSEQKDKVVADFLDWIYKPHATGDVNTRFLRRYRTVAGHTRWALDRSGMPAATVLHWQEFWPASNTLAGVTAITDFKGAVGGWRAVITGAGGGVNTEIDTVSRRVTIDGGDASGDESVLKIDGVPPLGANTDLAVEAIVSLESATSADIEHVFGIIIDTSDDPNASDGLRFLKTPGQANWHISSKNGGSETNNDSLVAAATNTQVRLRIEFRGANVNEGAAPAAYFFINGAHVGTITTNLPAAGSTTRQVAFGARNTTGSSGAAQKLRVFWVNFACAWSPAVTT